MRSLGAEVARLEKEAATSKAALEEVTHSKVELESTAGDKARRLARIEGVREIYRWQRVWGLGAHGLGWQPM